MSGPLSQEEVEAFIERGYVWVREAFTPEYATRAVAGVFGPDGTMEASYRRSAKGREPHEARGLPLDDCEPWGATRMDIETGFQVRIAELSPRLSAAMRQLTGGVELAREHMGELWILNLHMAPAPSTREQLELDRQDAFWHIDTPGPNTNLQQRFDALTLLVLWSDVAEGGGGTLYSTRAFHRLVDALIEAETGLDTEPTHWAQGLMDGCDDIESQVGRAGDVLVTHPFMPHARPRNYGKKVRILENPTITSSRPLDYSPANPDPSPVEEAVIRRIRRRPQIPPHMRGELVRRENLAAAELRLMSHYGARFLPGPHAEVPDDTAERLAGAVERVLFLNWVELHGRGLQLHQRFAVPSALAAIRLVRRLMVTSREVRSARIAATPLDARFFDRAWSRLVLGLADRAGMNHVVHALLRATGIEAHPFVTHSDGGERYDAVLVVEDGRAGFFDAASDHPRMWVEDLDWRRVCQGWEQGPPAISGPLEGLREYEELVSAGSGWGASKDAYLAGRALEPEVVAGWVAPRPSPETIQQFLDHPAPQSRGLPGSLTALLELRSRIVHERVVDPAGAMEAYLREHRVGGLTRELVRALIDRA